ncbi:hypothetical protein AMATHDRAFT_49088 [Amanita thiersii Skay4041]|uniref:Gpr1 family protein n=1 Tax=Amanita thiersii Skay4041 TaxID=703135 RepID=A0A2A9NMV2_9AGAR|nr:hypothetical protein AMATHDRAFT_49088 [Amanita thiersii Skay4041]
MATTTANPSTNAAGDMEKGHMNGYDNARITRKSFIGNPAPLGLFSFSATTFLLSLYNVNTRDVAAPNAVVGMGLFVGGLAQILAGMWEYPRGNTFGATAFTSYGAFWMSFAAVLIPGAGVREAFQTEKDYNNAVGLYLVIWFIFTSLLVPPVIRRNISLVILFATLALTFLLVGIGLMTGSAGSRKAGGAFGIISGVTAYYVGFSDLMSAEKSAFMRVPTGALSD